MLEIADKTAEYVAKNGSAFEEIVQRSEANNPKFSFLKPNDPYRAYFEQKVIEFAQGIGNLFFPFIFFLNIHKIPKFKRLFYTAPSN